MLKLFIHNRFQKDMEKAKKRGKDKRKLDEVVELLLEKKSLPLKYRNHKLQGNYDGCWECHVEPDWLLIYEKTKTAIHLLRTGSHSDLF